MIIGKEDTDGHWSEGGEARVLGETADRNWGKAVVFAAIHLKGAYLTARDANCGPNGESNLQHSTVLQTRLAAKILP
jgi:hypothetical protein